MCVSLTGRPPPPPPPPTPSQELVMDILRVLSSPDLEVRKKTLTLVLELINSRNVDEVRV